MRKALVVGIDSYERMRPLSGCVNDAHSVASVLSRNADNSVNFDVRMLCATRPDGMVAHSDLKDQVEELFDGDGEVALFYFSGHGCIDVAGGYLVTSDAKRGDDGLSLADLISFANESKAKNRIILLDSCYSGAVGASPSGGGCSIIAEGVTILTASTEDQYATEESGEGVFTRLLVDALNGAAANLVGDISPGSVYAHIDQSLGPWEQRPVFKTNVKSFVSLRKVQAAISLEDLRHITELFPESGYTFHLDPSFEPRDEGRTERMPKADVEHNRIFALLQHYNRVNLLIPVDAPHMWHAAMESKSCKLTPLGEHYRRLVERGRI